MSTAVLTASFRLRKGTFSQLQSCCTIWCWL